MSISNYQNFNSTSAPVPSSQATIVFGGHKQTEDDPVPHKCTSTGICRLAYTAGDCRDGNGGTLNSVACTVYYIATGLPSSAAQNQLLITFNFSDLQYSQPEAYGTFSTGGGGVYNFSQDHTLTDPDIIHNINNVLQTYYPSLSTISTKTGINIPEGTKAIFTPTPGNSDQISLLIPIGALNGEVQAYVTFANTTKNGVLQYAFNSITASPNTVMVPFTVTPESDPGNTFNLLMMPVCVNFSKVIVQVNSDATQTKINSDALQMSLNNKDLCAAITDYNNKIMQAANQRFSSPPNCPLSIPNPFPIPYYPGTAPVGSCQFSAPLVLNTPKYSIAGTILTAPYSFVFDQLNLPQNSNIQTTDYAQYVNDSSYITASVRFSHDVLLNFDFTTSPPTGGSGYSINGIAVSDGPASNTLCAVWVSVSYRQVNIPYNSATSMACSMNFTFNLAITKEQLKNNAQTFAYLSQILSQANGTNNQITLPTFNIDLKLLIGSLNIPNTQNTLQSIFDSIGFNSTPNSVGVSSNSPSLSNDNDFIFLTGISGLITNPAVSAYVVLGQQLGTDPNHDPGWPLIDSTQRYISYITSTQMYVESSGNIPSYSVPATLYIDQSSTQGDCILDVQLSTTGDLANLATLWNIQPNSPVFLTSALSGPVTDAWLQTFLLNGATYFSNSLTATFDETNNLITIKQQITLPTQ